MADDNPDMPGLGTQNLSPDTASSPFLSIRNFTDAVDNYPGKMLNTVLLSDPGLNEVVADILDEFIEMPVPLDAQIVIFPTSNSITVSIFTDKELTDLISRITLYYDYNIFHESLDDAGSNTLSGMPLETQVKYLKVVETITRWLREDSRQPN